MNTQNVSAQLYVKQLTPDPKAGVYGCDSQTYPYLSTCVDNIPTDTAIENAFQKQLDLSEYYKSPEVFDVMKKEYNDRTMEGENEAKPQIVPPSIPAMKPIPPMIPVGPTDFLKKMLNISSFGDMSGNIILIVIVIFIIGVICLSLSGKFKSFDMSGMTGYRGMSGNSGRGGFNINF